MLRLFPVSLLLAFLFSCSAGSEEKSDNEEKNNDIQQVNTIPAQNNIPASKPVVHLKVTGDSVEIPPFEIEVSLSTKAEEKLKADKETIIVDAYFSGIPKDTTLKKYRQRGELAVSSFEKELHEERVVQFEGIKFTRSFYDSLETNSLHVLINVYSGRRSSNVNLLDCDIVEKPISEIKGKKYIVTGKLIGEYK